MLHQDTLKLHPIELQIVSLRMSPRNVSLKFTVMTAKQTRLHPRRRWIVRAGLGWADYGQISE